MGFGSAYDPTLRQGPFRSNGERIFRTGTSSSGESITARIGMMTASGGSLACADCHGRTGRGQTIATMMGSFSAPDISGKALFSAGSQKSEHDHPAYTSATLKRAITQGLDPEGQPLAFPMPRWSMVERDLDDLVSYLQKL